MSMKEHGGNISALRSGFQRRNSSLFVPAARLNALPIADTHNGRNTFAQTPGTSWDLKTHEIKHDRKVIKR